MYSDNNLSIETCVGRVAKPLIICLEFMIGTQWLQSRVEMNGYEEYSGTEYRSAGCTEEYTVLE